MEEHSFNAPPQGIMFVLSFLFWFFIHVDSAKALSNKLLPIFIFIIFALCFLSSHTPLRSPYVVRDDNVRSYRGDFPVNDVESYLADFPVDVDDVESVPSLSEEEMESRNSEEIIIDKHIILVEDDIGDMDAFSWNNSEDDWEQNYPSNIDPNFNWQFL